MIIQIIKYGSPLYRETLDFRFKILRNPFGLKLSKKDSQNEDKQIHIAALVSDKVLGTVVLKPISQNKIKLRQMAVDPRMHGNGVGRKLVTFAEEFAKSKNYKLIEMNARISAMGFYQKLGYQVEGHERNSVLGYRAQKNGEFEEVAICSITMIKKLDGDRSGGGCNEL